MVQQTQVVLVDDITGREIVDGEGETVQFTYQGTSYQLDLDAKNAKKYHDALAFYVAHAQKLGRSGNIAPTRRGRKNETVDNTAVRAWAESNGYEVSSRGRIKAEIVEAFRAANA